MSNDSFRQRATTLEDEFFYRVDQQLIQTYKDRQQQAFDTKSLSEATGIVDQSVLKELHAAEVTPNTLLAFSLFPSVFVAWSDRHVESAERAAILKAAHQQGIHENSDAYKLLESWLDHKPKRELVDAWKDFIHAIRETVSDDAFREMRNAAMQRAEEISKASGGFLGLGAQSHAEKTALAELNAVFDHAEESGASEE